MSTRLWLVASTAGAFLGCGGIPQGFKDKAAASLRCPESQLVYEDTSILVRGCGKSDAILRASPNADFESLRERAVFEFSCTDEQIEITRLGSSYAASGCGKKATYKAVRNVGFVMDSATSPSL